jgi:preprotein translocase subunit SecG
MKTLLITFQFISAFLLIGAILLHTAKGEGLGGIGGQARIFGSQKGLEAGLDRVTTTIAVIFITLSLILSIITIS